MGCLVVMGAQLKCSEGASPGALTVVRPMVLADNKPAANIMDNKPVANVAPFGMCNSKTNPAVIAATSAAQGVHTPAPCVPVIAAPWAPGKPMVLIENQPALDEDSTVMCNWAGTIEVTDAGQDKVELV
jgi:hypothetical protein